ncbi:hypothetical protein [Terrimonas sp.]|uniref:hypothetical protein n=1 Tax=Terrimonas sp. TaxID=1914338 RepID=UPI001057547F|nr:hypothetical protein [Terrimonas sp.]
MKKLKLRALELGAEQILSREQMKRVIGGEVGSCAVYLPNGATSGSVWSNIPTDPDYNYKSMTINNGVWTVYGVTKDTASGQAASMGGSWCCTSCSSASWYHPPAGSS